MSGSSPKKRGRESGVGWMPVLGDDGLEGGGRLVHLYLACAEEDAEQHLRSRV